VKDGVFGVTLDFGNIFAGDALWLEIGVRSNGTSVDFQRLAPRQLLAFVPYALYSSRAGVASSAATVTEAIPAAQLTGTIAASNIGSGTISAGMLATGAAISNLYAGGQSGVAGGGIVLSENPSNQDLMNAGYVKIGKVDLISEGWSSNAPGPGTYQPQLCAS